MYSYDAHHDFSMRTMTTYMYMHTCDFLADINAGIIGSRFILEVLTRFGHADLALALATEPTCPSWSYMVQPMSSGQGRQGHHDTPGVSCSCFWCPSNASVSTNISTVLTTSPHEINRTRALLCVVYCAHASQTVWESWQDLHTIGVSKNHPALSGGIGLWLYQLAGLAEESAPHQQLVFRPPRETLAAVGAAELHVETPQGPAWLRWRYTESQGFLGLLRDEYSREFEANISIPLQLPQNSLLHIPILNKPGEEQSNTLHGASVVLWERGCNCTIWSSDEAHQNQSQAAAAALGGVVSVKLVASPLARQMDRVSDTVVVELTGGEFGFHVAVRS